MGKGEIISHLGDGQYSVRLLYDNARASATLARLQDRIDALAEYIATLDDGEEKTIAQLRKTACEKEYAKLLALIPENAEIDAWCVDFTTDLTGYVGTIEISAETDAVQIRPGYDGAAAYNQARDGQLQHAVSGTPASVFYNLAMMPGWQRWMPAFRVGTIVTDSIDYNSDTCDVCLDSANSAHLNININQDAGFESCTASSPAGYGVWAAENPTHPLVTNTTDPAPIHVTDELYDQIVSVQQQVNTSHAQLTDPAGWGVGELWRIMEEGEAGDCEDFALTKAQALLDLGWAAGHLRIAVCETELGTSHAVLMIETANRGTLVLDNRYDLPMGIGRMPYRFLSRQKAGTTWEAYSPVLEAVPIEYMTCNAVAFADGDRVVVEFEGQDWSSPKVVGFESEPTECQAPLLMATRRSSVMPDYDGDGYIYKRNADLDWVLWGSIPGMPEVGDIVKFGSYYYAVGAKNRSPITGKVYRSSNGESWSEVHDLGDNFHVNREPNAFTAHTARLVATDSAIFVAFNNLQEISEDSWEDNWWTEIYRSTDGLSWALFWSCDLALVSHPEIRKNFLADFDELNGNLYIAVGWAGYRDTFSDLGPHGKLYKINISTGSAEDITFNQEHPDPAEGFYPQSIYRIDIEEKYTHDSIEWDEGPQDEFLYITGSDGEDIYWWTYLVNDEEWWDVGVSGGGVCYCLSNCIYVSEPRWEGEHHYRTTFNFLFRDEFSKGHYISLEDFVGVSFGGDNPLSAVVDINTKMCVAAYSGTDGLTIWEFDPEGGIDNEHPTLTKTDTISDFLQPTRLIKAQ